MAKAVRLSDIAEKLNVSTVTVSKALAGQKGVSEKVRMQIIALAEEMGYEKQSSGKGRKRTKSYNIGVIVAEYYLRDNESLYWQLYQELSQEAMKRNSFILLEIVRPKTERLCEIPLILEENKVNGLIILGTFQKKYMDAVIKETKVPTLYLDTTTGEEGGDFVLLDNVTGSCKMMDHLFELGHHKIGFVGSRGMAEWIDDRFLGYIKSYMEHKYAYKEEWLIDDRDRARSGIDFRHCFSLPADMPTAFFCCCDMTAQALIRKLNEAGYRVPEDISVAGFGAYDREKQMDIGITSYEINVRKMARQSIHIMYHKMDKKEYSSGIYMISGRVADKGSVIEKQRRRLADKSNEKRG